MAYIDKRLKELENVSTLWLLTALGWFFISVLVQPGWLTLVDVGFAVLITAFSFGLGEQRMLTKMKEEADDVYEEWRGED